MKLNAIHSTVTNLKRLVAVALALIIYSMIVEYAFSLELLPSWAEDELFFSLFAILFNLDLIKRSLERPKLTSSLWEASIVFAIGFYLVIAHNFSTAFLIFLLANIVVAAIGVSLTIYLIRTHQSVPTIGLEEEYKYARGIQSVILLLYTFVVLSPSALIYLIYEAVRKAKDKKQHPF